jgi:hypothetical protein
MGMIDGVVTLAVEGCSMGGNIRPGLGRHDPTGCDYSGRDDAVWDRLSQRQALALTVLVDGGPVSNAASAAGVSKSSVHRWLKLPYFLAALRLVREERRRPYLELKKLLDDPQTEPHIRIRAAEDLHDMVKPPDHDPPWRGLDKKATRPILAIVP